MGDENPIRTLGDYSKPSHEGYRNTIELPVGNNVDPNQHLKDFLKLVDSLNLDEENRERTRLRLFQFSLRDQASNWLERLSAESITTWEDLPTRFLAQFFPPRRTVKLRNDILMFQKIIDNLYLKHELTTPLRRALTKPGLQKRGWPNMRKKGGLMPSFQMKRPIHPGDVIDWEFLANQGLARSFLNSINTDPFSGPQWMNLFQISEPIGGEQREMSLLDFGWRVGLYTEQQSRDGATLSRLRNTKVKSISDPKIMLTHRCIATTISGRKESTHRVTEMDLYYLYSIYTNEVICNIPYWLAKYLKSVGDQNLICGGMFITRIVWSFGVLTGVMMNALSVEPPPYVFKKKSLIAMGVIMELHDGGCCWPATREAMVEEEDKGDDEGNEAAGGYTGHEGVGGSTNVYHNMSQGDWQIRQA
ncbi:retrotransposon ORF1 [Tanacetum coccineum]